jgi:hypothetical protein
MHSGLHNFHLQVGWRDGDTANMCIGQGKLDVTPLQMAMGMAGAGVPNDNREFVPLPEDKLKMKDNPSPQALS